MVAREAWFPDRRFTVSIEAGQHDRRFDLGAGYGRSIVNCREAPAVDCKRGKAALVSARNACSHEGKGLNHPFHRPLSQVLVSGYHRKERLAGQQAGNQADCSSRITAVDHVARLAQPVQALAFYGDGFAVIINPDSHGTESLYCGKVISAPQKAADSCDAFGKGTQHD